MVALTVVALFLSAFLLFFGELLTGKLLLPAHGGAPQVFVTSLLVFQALLLAGYAIAAWLTRGAPTRARLAAQVGLLVIGVLFGPPALTDSATALARLHPILDVIGGVVVVIGAPFLALSVHAPLLQRWLSLTSSARGRDPYFLYVASNAGSFAGLVAFPLVIEPLLDVVEQGTLFFALYAVAALLVAALLAFTPLAPAHGDASSARAPLPLGLDDARVLALGALPALHLGATTLLLSLDLAAIPLLWVLPLAAYLLSFVVAFSSAGARATAAAARVLPFLLIAIAFIVVTRATEPALMLLALHLAVFFVGAVVCHGHVAMRRPEPARLTRFYLVLSSGGAIGGALAAVVAPLVFSSLAELPLALALLPLAAPRDEQPHDDAPRRALARDAVAPLVIVVAGGVVLLLTRALELHGVLARALMGVPVGLVVVAKGTRRRLALALGAVFVLGALLPAPEGEVLRAERSFFGVHRVIRDGAQKKLYQGTTEHGSQHVDDEQGIAPGAYYHPRGPAGDALTRLADDGRAVDVALIGLGSGALAAYARAGARFTFYEIDEAVARLAEHEFSFLRGARARGAAVDIVLGDGRKSIERPTLKGRFDVVVMDAFTSGAVPVHLLTREAIDAVRATLGPRGVILMHISNRHLDLEAVVSRVAKDLALVARTKTDLAHDAPDERAPSQWLALAADEASLAVLGPRWVSAEHDDNTPLFTDRRSNLVSVLRD